MKKILPAVISVFLVLAVLPHPAPAQDGTSALTMMETATQEMQKTDPKAAQDFTNAIKRGDLAGAKKIYQDFKAGEKGVAAAAAEQSEETSTSSKLRKPSLFEQTLSGGAITDLAMEDLRQFGYDLFRKTVSTFTPPATMPVGPDYIIGPGDQFTLTLWGTTEGIYTLQVTKEGNVTLPKVGVVTVAGIRFGDLERTLKRYLSRYYSNFNLSVAMGGLRTLTVYVVGEVANPGSYSISSLSTVYSALFAAGGPVKEGSLRTIQVLRSGKVIKTLDLYDFLLKGDRSQDIRLQNEDTVFVPLIGPVAGVSGMVYRPAIYELKGGETLGDVIETAGGLLPTALGGRLQLTRYSDNKEKVLLDITLAGKKAPELAEKAQNMDLISIRPVNDRIWEVVNLRGEVAHPGNYQWRPDLKLKEIIDKGGLLPTSDLRRAEVVRLTKDLQDRNIIPVDLQTLMQGDETQNIVLQPQDQVRVYTMYRQAEKVSVSGEVVRPGDYEIMNGERLSDLLRRVGGFTKVAYVYGLVFKRQHVKSSEAKNLQNFIARMQAQVLQTAAESAATSISTEESSFAKSEFSLNQGLLTNLKNMQEQTEGRVAINVTENIDSWAGSKDDLLLQEGDSIMVPKRPQEVLVLGEVYSPGAEIYLPDTTVGDYVDKAGGVTKYADKDQIYVVKANGFAYGADSPSVGSIGKETLKAGDAVFVPQKVERYAAMRTTKDIVDILFKTAVVIATITVLF